MARRMGSVVRGGGRGNGIIVSGPRGFDQLSLVDNKTLTRLIQPLVCQYFIH